MHLWTVSPGLVGGDDHICGYKEGSILRRGNHIVSLVPDPLIHALEKNELEIIEYQVG